MKSVILLLTVFLYMHQACGQYSTCSSEQRCEEFRSCSEFKEYVNTSPSSWPDTVKTEVRNRLCKVEQRGNSKIYSICCKVDPPVKKSGGLALLDRQSCGASPSGHIVAFREKVNAFDFPWMALLGNVDRRFACTGSLIAASYVLTAAECNQIEIVLVRLGENDFSKRIDCVVEGDLEDCADAPQDIAVAKFIAHPQYDPQRLKNDIALIKLATAAKLSESVRPICLPIGPFANHFVASLLGTGCAYNKQGERVCFPPGTFYNYTEPRMIIAGWDLVESSASSDDLRQTAVVVRSRGYCNSIFRTIDNTTTPEDTSRFCAGGENKGDSCSGDTGGPLQGVSVGSSQAVQYGILSFWPDSCGTKLLPGGYTNVTHFIEWILENMD